MNFVRYVLLLLLFGMSTCATFQNTELWRKSKAIANGERPASADNSNDKVYFPMPVFETQNLEYVQVIGLGIPFQYFLAWINLQCYDLVIPSTNCTTADCKRIIEKFDPDASGTFKPSSNYSAVSLPAFLAKGYYASEFVTLKTSTRRTSVKWVKFLLADHLESTAVATSGFDGLLCLQSSLRNDSFIDSYFKNAYLMEPLLTIWLSSSRDAEPAGFITYGAIDKEHCTSPTQYAPMLGGYLIESQGFALGRYRVSRQHEMQFTMEAWIKMYKIYTDAIARLIEATYDEGMNVYNISCNAKFADLSINVDNATLDIPSEELILEVYPNRCILAIIPYEKELGEEPIYIGAPFYRRYCTTFYVASRQIGFAPAFRTTAAPPTTLPASEPPTSSPSTSKPTTSSPMTSSPTTSSPATKSTHLPSTQGSTISLPSTPSTGAGTSIDAIPSLFLLVLVAALCLQ